MDDDFHAEEEKEPEHDNVDVEALGEQWAWNDVTGAVLDPKVVAEEREKENLLPKLHVFEMGGLVVDRRSPQ